MGSLIAAELSVKYKAQAVEYADVREFPHANSCVLGPAVINTHTVSRSFVPGQLSTSDRPIDHCHNHDTEQSLAVIKLEEAKYASICGSVLANTEPFMDAGIFDLGLFWTGQKSALPVHYSLWLAEVGCAKVASANVEVVFSCAGRISMKSLCLDLQLFSDYAFLIYNYKYDWLRPKLEEIVAAYMKPYGQESRDSMADNESDGSNGTGGLEEEDGEGRGEED